MSKFVPLHNNIAVKTDEEKERTTPGGIFIPSTADPDSESVVRATVIAVGRGRRSENGTLIEPSVKVNDIVLLAPPMSFPTVNTGEGKLHIVTEDDLLGVEEPEEKA